MLILSIIYNSLRCCAKVEALQLPELLGRDLLLLEFHGLLDFADDLVVLHLLGETLELAASRYYKNFTDPRSTLNSRTAHRLAARRSGHEGLCRHRYV